MNQCIDSISDMKLTWCKLFSVESDKFGGWVSENWCSFGRITKWIYSLLDEIIPLENFVEPQKNVNGWTTKECDAYIKYYGIKFKGKAHKRREFVRNIYSDNNIIKMNPKQRYGSTEQVEHVIHSLNSVMSHVMSKDVTESLIQNSDRLIRIFLHNLDQLDLVINKSRTKSKLQTSYSFLAALQLPDVMRKYGSIRNVWEGTYIGEGILSSVKPLIKDLRKNWHINAGRKYNRKRSINKILQQFTHENVKDDFERNYSVYLDYSYTLNLVSSRKPISAVCLRNGEFRIILSSNQSIRMILKDLFTTICGLSYFRWDIHNEADRMEIKQEMVKHYCILLPCMKSMIPSHEDNDILYGLITSEWLELNSNGKITQSGNDHVDMNNLV